jgi:tRNA nucleotidyltransferase (CCA-adding enzyme)
MHMPGAGADGAIVTPAGASGDAAADAALAWQRLRAEEWPIPREAFPTGTALVGGAVRDALLDRLGSKPDLDLVVPADALALCRQLSRRHGGSTVVLDAERSIARLAIRGWSVDLARQEGPSLEADLRRRDYTVNAIALPLEPNAALVDPTGGLGHLQARVLVAVSEANLLDDPLRLLRGLRLASELGFELDATTWAWIQQHHGRIATVAGERVLAELEKLAGAPLGQRGLQQTLRCGLLQPWAPPGSSLTSPNALEALTPTTALAAGLSAEETLEALPLARLAALLDAQALKALRSSRKWQQRVERLRHWQQRLGTTAPAAVACLPEADRLQLHRQLEADLPALLLGWPPEQAQPWLTRWRDPNDPLFHPRAALDGGSLQRELGLRPSPQLGALLDHLMLEQAFGRIQNRKQALEQAQAWLTSTRSSSEMAPRRD